MVLAVDQRSPAPGARRSPRAAFRPPNPPPMITTRGMMDVHPDATDVEASRIASRMVAGIDDITTPSDFDRSLVSRTSSGS